MALQQLPIRKDFPAYNFQVDLDGALYNIEIRFNQRMGRWIMDISDEQNLPIVVGTPVFTNQNLVGRFALVRPKIPPGILAAIDLSNNNQAPDENNFGDDVKLIYAEEGTVFE